METFFSWLLISYGMTHIITGTKIFEWLRVLLDKISPNFFGFLIQCPACTGFWIGVVLSFLYMPMAYGINVFATYLINGCLSSGINWLLFMFMDFLNEYTTLVIVQRNKLLGEINDGD